VPKKSAGVSGTLAEATRLLEDLGLRYAVVGGLAVGVWGVNRSTDDVDIFIELPERRRGELRRSLVRQGFLVPAMIEELDKFGVFRSRSKQGIFLDLFDAVGPLGEAVLARRRELPFRKRRLWFVAPEELAVLKLFSERERDFEDFVSLLGVLAETLDLAYIKKWAERLDESIGGNDITERLERALALVRKRR
jgi:hypothetical protein